MEFDTFLKKFKVQLGQGISELCNEGIEIMKNSNDIRHNYSHVLDLLSELSNLIKYENLSINYDVLLPAICWHDTWHATQPFTKNSMIMFYRILYEGYGSAQLFKSSTKKYLSIINNHVLDDICSAIMTHVRTGWGKFDQLFYVPRSLEGKILKDIDELDTWSIKRVVVLEEIFFRSKLPNGYLWLMNWYINNMISPDMEDIFYLNYSKQQIANRKKAFIDWLVEKYTLIRKSPSSFLEKPYNGHFFDMTINEFRDKLYTRSGILS